MATKTPITGTNVGSTKVETVLKTPLSNATNLATTATTTATTTTTTTAVAPTTIAATAAMFMRAKTVTFTALGLKPNTEYYPFFNGVSVASFCSLLSSPEMVSGQIKEFSTVGSIPQRVLKTDSLGQMTGNFYLPANTFIAGSHVFLLVDRTRVVGTTIIPDPIYGSADARYEANGILKTQQTQITVNTTTSSTAVTTVSATNPSVTTTPIVQCESWYFEYAIYDSSKTYAFTVTTNSATAPAASTVKPQSGSPTILNQSITFVNTSVGANNTWYHTYVARTGTGGGTIPISIYRQEWIGTKINGVTQDRPSLTSYKPSGITGTSVVSIITPWTRIKEVACPINLGFGSPTTQKTTNSAPYDPLAQSFFIDSATYPDGVFVTSIALYFKTVDQSTGVTVELRDMSNGMPGSQVFPGGKAYVPGSSTAQSPDATMSTLFRFDYPVFLKPNDEYCFVVKSASLGYNCWCAKMGEIDVTTKKVIDTQPFTGSMFMSENNYTWIADSTQDIKFDLNVAVFDTTKTSNLIFKPQKMAGATTATAAGYFAVGNIYTIATLGDTNFVSIGAVLSKVGITFKATGVGSGTGTAVLGSNQYYGTGINLPLSFMSTTKGVKTVGINIPMHGLVTGDTILIEGIGTPSAGSYNNILAANLNGVFTVTVINEDQVTILTTGNNATKTGFLSVKDQFNNINNAPPVTNPSTTFVDAERYVNSGTNSPSTVQASIAVPSAPTPPTLVSSNSFTVYPNVQLNEVMIDFLGTEMPGTSIVENISLVTGVSTSGTETAYGAKDYEVIDRADFHSFEEPRLITSPSNQSLRNTSSNMVKIEMSSTNKNLSPVIDVNGMSLMTRSYKIDNQDEELDTLIAASPGTGFTVGQPYMIHSTGSTDFTLIGAPSNAPGTCFIATGAGTGTGTAYKNTEILSGGGNAQAKYKTIVRQTEDFHQRMMIFVTANSPSPAVIDAYVRTSTDRETHIDQEWTWVPLKNVYDTAFNHSLDKSAIGEWMYELTTAEAFNIYDIKLVMRSQNNSIVPKIYGVRTITDFT